MIDDRPELTNEQPADAGTLAQQRRLLELQLVKIRSEAAAARLDARAAEIESMIRQLAAAGEPGSSLTPLSVPTRGADAPVDLAPIHPVDGATERFLFDSWDDVRCARVTAQNAQAAAVDPNVFMRVDSGQTKIPRPHLGDVRIASNQLQGDVPQQRRRRPAALLVSAIAHIAVLVLLAAVTLQTHRPKDQVALSASAADATEISMETFTIQSSEPTPQATEPTPSETQHELSPIGELSVNDFSLHAPASPLLPAAAAMASGERSSATAMSLNSNADAKIQFCGVAGGGNHFVYLVDSSASMADGFQSARAELLASIAVLKPDQRFYVIFFDANSDFMRLSDGRQDEPQSVHATPANKAALKRWAMGIAMDRGRAPYEPLRFALNLKPDVIFLLSDGEFPQGIEDLLRKENRVENLFGDSHPISIVHTIGYYSKEGESRMRRIAEQNEGQYRYIPKP